MSDVKHFVAADRFVDAQHWWIAAELCRRHPEVSLLENEIPGIGNLIEAVLVRPEGILRVGFSRVAGIRTTADPEFVIPPPALLEQDDAHAVLKRVEEASGLGVPGPQMRTTPHNVGYRFIAHLLGTAVNSRHAWNVRGERPADPNVCEDLSWMGEAEDWPAMEDLQVRWFEEAVEGKLYSTPRSQAWLIMRDLHPVAVVDLYGFVHTPQGSVDLMKLYKYHQGRLAVMVPDVLGEWMQ